MPSMAVQHLRGEPIRVRGATASVPMQSSNARSVRSASDERHREQTTKTRASIAAAAAKTCPRSRTCRQSTRGAWICLKKKKCVNSLL